MYELAGFAIAKAVELMKRVAWHLQLSVACKMRRSAILIISRSARPPAKAPENHHCGTAP